MKAFIDRFFDGPTIDVARRLIGARIIRRVPPPALDEDSRLVARIVETEAYLPLLDPACHGYRGPTARNASIFGRPGYAYVYFIYGNHYCLNVVTEPPGIGGAVLIRAAEPLAGIEPMRRLRGAQVATAALASGPGNLCRAMAIDLTCDGADLRRGGLLIRPPVAASFPVAVSGRIGVAAAAGWPLRFYDPQSPSISPFRKAKRCVGRADDRDKDRHAIR